MSALDEDATTAWIAGLGIGADGPLTYSRVGQGQSNLTYRVADAGEGRWILRRPPVGTLLASAHDVAREHRILRALQETDVATPAIFGFTDDPAVTDAPLLLMEWIDGLVIDGVATAEATPRAVRRGIGSAMPLALADVHAVDLQATGLTDLASHKPYAARQLKRWRMQWEHSRSRDVPEVERLADRLEAAAPEQRELTVVHGDFHLLNVISAPDGSGIRAVLDWELCTLGDPLADLGGLLAYWPEATDAFPGVFPASRLPGFPTRSELTTIYAERTGRDVAAVPFWHALGLWKIAIICEGVRRRASLDPSNTAASGGPSEADVDALVAEARAVADRAGL